MTSRPKGHPEWKQIVKYARKHPRKFKWVYSKRNRIEAAFWSLKSLVGDYLRCKLERTQTIEIWLKVIVYNLVWL